MSKYTRLFTFCAVLASACSGATSMDDGGTDAQRTDGGGDAGDVCASRSNCTAAGVACSGDTLVTCAADSDGCLVETRTTCTATDQTCSDASGTAACVDPCS